VVGGGPPAWGCDRRADAGADVILVERHAFLGGNATAALVIAHVLPHPATGGAERLG
jgi:heterodisulfide reductase subunit A-like polyferredoxin